MDMPSIFDYLDAVRQRPSMYASSIANLELSVQGYYAALDVHNVREDVPDMTNKFSVWTHVTTGWSTSCGWGDAFDRHTAAKIDRFHLFFSYVDRYRLLKPTVVGRVSLCPEHQPTGRRCVIGTVGRMERPDEILIINYAPTSLHHLRHRYCERYVDDWFLMLGDGSHQTTPADLMQWVAAEFNVDSGMWTMSR